jgi:hypothetical protein
LVRLYSIGYHNADAISLERETRLLNAESESPAVLAQRAQVARPGSAPQPQGISLLLQEEQLGQHLEKRMRTIFRLPDVAMDGAVTPGGRVGGAAGFSTPRAQTGGASASSSSSAAAAGGAPAPSSLRELEPERERSSALGGVLALTAAGKAQVRAGTRLCSRFDAVPLLPEGPDGALPIVCRSDEIPAVLRWAVRTEKKLKEERGWKINLRPLANQSLFITLVVLLLLVILFGVATLRTRLL